jgi:hypothetical protein
LYQAKRTHAEKATIAMGIIDYVHNRRGRFLVRDEDGVWSVAEPDMVRKKVMQSLRDKKAEPAASLSTGLADESPRAPLAGPNRIVEPAPTDFLLGRGGKPLRAYGLSIFYAAPRR